MSFGKPFLQVEHGMWPVGGRGPLVATSCGLGCSSSPVLLELDRLWIYCLRSIMTSDVTHEVEYHIRPAGHDRREGGHFGNQQRKIQDAGHRRQGQLRELAEPLCRSYMACGLYHGLWRAEALSEFTSCALGDVLSTPGFW